MSIRRRGAILLAVVLSASPTALGATKTWLNGVNGTYQIGANWSGGTAPLPGDDVNFTLNDLGYIVSFSASATASTFTMTNDNVTLDLNTFTYTLAGGGSVFDVLGGPSGGGNLNITDGTVDSDAVGSSANIGTSGSSATVDVLEGGVWRVNTLNVGGSATATAILRAQSGGDLFAGDVTLRSNGQALVFMPDSSMTVADDLRVGDGGGKSSLSVLSGGVVNVGDDLILGSTGSEGAAAVSGSGAALSVTGDLTVGSGGIGIMDVLSTTTVTGATTLGLANASNGTLVVRGGQFNASSVSIGVSGSGNMEVAGSGDVTTSGLIIIGSATSGSGTLTMHGSSSTWTGTASTLVVGAVGTGTLIVEDAASATFANTGVGSGFGSVGEAFVRNNGTLDVGLLNVGDGGRGTLTIEAGGTVNATDLDIGAGTTGVGVVTVTGPDARFSSAGQIDIGPGGAGTLVINPGGRVSAPSTAATVIGPQGRLDVNGGTLSTGSLINAGGLLNFNSGSISLNSSSIIPVIGPAGPFGATLRLDHTRTLEFRSINIDSTGLVLLEGGSFGGFTVHNSGELRLASPDSTVTAFTSLANSGLVTGSGRIIGALDNEVSGEVRAAAGDQLRFLMNTTHTNLGRINLFDGFIDVTGGLTNSGQVNLAEGAITIAGSLSNTTLGVVSGRGTLRAGGINNNGTIAASFGILDIHGPVTNQSSGKIILSGASQTTFHDNVTNAAGAAIRVNDGASVVFFGSVTNSGTITGGGDKYFEGGFSGVGPLATTGTSSVAPAAVLAATHIRELALTVEGAVTVQPNGTQLGTSRLGALTIHGGGTLDLANNDLIIDAGNLAQIEGYLASGQLTSSATTGITSLGAILNGPRFATFSGQLVSPDDVLVKYTYIGDANLDGRVSTADYLVIDRGVARGLAGWANGDFNYSGVIDGADYFLMDQAFLGQGGVLFSPLAQASQATAVPEPFALPILLLPAVLLRRRRGGRMR